MSDEKSEIVARAIIPAQSGWLLAVFFEADKDPVTGIEYPPGVLFEPIIAWDITIESGPFAPGVRKDPNDRWTNRWATPIVASGDNADGMANRNAIVRPDGKYEFPADCTCKDQEEAIRHVFGGDK